MRACLAVLALAACSSGTSATAPEALDSAAGTVRVEVRFAGNNDQVLVTSAPRGLSCTNAAGDPLSSCVARFPKGTPVLLTAVRNICGFKWSGACSGTYCALDGMSDETLTITVDDLCPLPPGGLLTVDVKGPGRVGSDTVQIDCGSRCSAGVPTTSEILLTAEPLEGAKFVGWSGACSGTGECRVATVSPPWHVAAEFSR